MGLANLDDLEAEWAEFMHDREGKRSEWSQDQRWRDDNPGKLAALIEYRQGGVRPDFSGSPIGSPERRMVEHLDAYMEARDLVPPPPPPPPVKSLIQTIVNGAKLAGRVDWSAVYDGDADDVPDDPGSIQFFVDGQLVLTENIPPFGSPTSDNAFWDSSSVDDGPHTFQVKALDPAGTLIIESEVATADVDNVAEPPPPPPPTATRVARAAYEGYPDVGDVPLWRTHGEQAKADDRMRIVDDPLGQRGKVARIEVRSGDSAVAGSGAGERADVMASANSVPMREGTIFAAKLGLMLPDEFRSNGSGWNVFIGAHDASGGTQSPLQFEIRDGRDMRLRILGGVKQPGGLGTFRLDLGPWPLARNRWYDIVWGMRFSADPTKGRAVLLLDGAKLVDRAVANLYSGSYSYHKQGWYRVAQTETTVLYMDTTDFWMADTVENAVAAAAAAIG